MEQSLNNLNLFKRTEELDNKLNQIMGVLIILESAMESEHGFITIQPVAKHAVTAALNMAEECSKLNQKAFKQLPSIAA